MRTPRRGRGGFTLLEMIAVFVLICLLAGLLVPTIGNVIERSRICSTFWDMNEVKDAAKRYQLDVGTFPGAVDPYLIGNPFNYGYDPGLVQSGNILPLPIPASWDGPYLDFWRFKNAWGSNNTTGASRGCYSWVAGDVLFNGATLAFPAVDNNTNTLSVGRDDHYVLFAGGNYTNASASPTPPGVGQAIDDEFDDGLQGFGRVLRTNQANLGSTSSAGDIIFLYAGEGKNSN